MVDIVYASPFAAGYVLFRFQLAVPVFECRYALWQIIKQWRSVSHPGTIVTIETFTSEALPAAVSNRYALRTAGNSLRDPVVCFIIALLCRLWLDTNSLGPGLEGWE